MTDQAISMSFSSSEEGDEGETDEFVSYTPDEPVIGVARDGLGQPEDDTDCSVLLSDVEHNSSSSSEGEFGEDSEIAPHRRI